jgi:hypothetical protein
MTLQRSAAAFTLFTALTFPGWALAQDVPPVVDALLKSMENRFSIKPVYKSVSGDAANATIEGLEASVPADKGAAMKMTIDKIELKNVVDKGNGLYEVGQAASSGFKMDIGAEGQSISVSIPQSNAEGLYLKFAGEEASPADQFRASMSLAHKMTAGPTTVTVAGQNITVDSMEMTWEGDPETGAGKSAGKVSNIAVPESAIAMMDPTGTLKQLGYGSLSFEIGGEGTMTNDGTNFGFDFDGYYAAKDMGAVKFGAAVSGIPTAVVSQIQKTEPGKTPDMTALMPQLMTVQFGRLTFRFEDASITKKILPLIAQMQGMDEATFIANAGAMAQLGLAELKNPDFTAQAVAAIGSFLKEPHSITISAQPPAPVPVMQLMSLDPANPGAAIQQLGISIKAND